MSRSDLTALAAHCAERNGERNVSGILLFSSGHFMQALEGPTQTIVELLKKITKDTRHTDVEQLFIAPTTTRIFDQWKMGMLNLDQDADLFRFAFIPTVQNLREKLTTNDSTAITLLREFRTQLPTVRAA